jgi:hypothetical protein
MPTNAAVLSQLQNEAIYGKEALARIIPLLRDAVGAGFEAGSDALQVFHGTVTALAAGGEIRTNAGVNIYAIHVDSPAAATQDVLVRVFNTSTGGIALTTTGFTASAEMIGLGCAKTKSKTAVYLPQGVEFQTGASYAVVDAANLNTAAVAGSAPTVTILYSNR